MASLNLNRDVRLMALGIKVPRLLKVIPQTATENIYTISGGRIVVVGLIGTVTTVIGGTAVTLSVGTVPTVGTAAPAGLASAVAITSKEVGLMVALPATLGGALIVGGTPGTAGGAGAVDNSLKQVLAAGKISITTSASTTGAMSWDLVYIPLDDGVQVVAA